MNSGPGINRPLKAQTGREKKEKKERNMAKIRLTKNELKRQREDLKRFRRYLPMLQLKKKQLQVEIIRVHKSIGELAGEIEHLRSGIIAWVDVFAESINIEEFISLKDVQTREGNVAGIDIPVYEGADFKEKEYDLLLVPFWVDKAIEAIKATLEVKARLAVLHKQMEILKEELRITNQRVNLFEKVKIPQAQENIRLIQIYLGELRTAEVVRGKIAKAKIEERKAALSL
jgi:V/A-type H+-transporting ATPase subunit D